jgi:hypothetical protein
MKKPSLRPRGSRPDAETPASLILVKNVSRLRATYQVRLLALRALEERRTLLLRVPPHCTFEEDLAGLCTAAPGLIVREDLA